MKRLDVVVELSRWEEEMFSVFNQKPKKEPLMDGTVVTVDTFSTNTFTSVEEHNAIC